MLCEVRKRRGDELDERFGEVGGDVGVREGGAEAGGVRAPGNRPVGPDPQRLLLQPRQAAREIPVGAQCVELRQALFRGFDQSSPAVSPHGEHPVSGPPENAGGFCVIWSYNARRDGGSSARREVG